MSLHHCLLTGRVFPSQQPLNLEITQFYVHHLNLITSTITSHLGGDEINPHEVERELVLMRPQFTGQVHFETFFKFLPNSLLLHSVKGDRNYGDGSVGIIKVTGPARPGQAPMDRCCISCAKRLLRQEWERAGDRERRKVLGRGAGIVNKALCFLQFPGAHVLVEAHSPILEETSVSLVSFSP